MKNLDTRSSILTPLAVIFRSLACTILFVMFSGTSAAQGFVDLALGGRSICAIDATGVLECTVPFGNRSIPPEDDAVFYRAVSSGSSHTCAITQTGDIRCWGINFVNQLDVPVIDSEFVALSATGNHTCAIDANTQVHCWGQSSGGQLDVPEPNILGFNR